MVQQLHGSYSTLPWAEADLEHYGGALPDGVKKGLTLTIAADHTQNLIAGGSLHL